MTSTTSAPAEEFAWLIELPEDRQFLGYFRLAGPLDPSSGKLVYRVPASLLEGTPFLPARAHAGHGQPPAGVGGQP